MVPTEVLCGIWPHGLGEAFATQLLLVPAEMKTNDSSKLLSQECLSLESCFFAHLTFWSLKDVLLFLHLHSLIPQWFIVAIFTN